MIPYILHVAVILSLCLAFYKLMLQKQTYYRLNRLVLIICMLAAFLLPFIHVPKQIFIPNSASSLLDTHQSNYEAVRETTPDKINRSDFKADNVSGAILQPGEVLDRQILIKWLSWIYWFGAMVFGINFFVQMIVLFYQFYKRPAIKDGIYRIVELETNKAPCSFGNYIFINPAKYDWDTYNRILTHEKIHIKERHSIDLLLTELMLVVQWFNPFAWLYRKDVECNLEYLTDNAVLQQHQIDPAAYQWSLLQVSVPNYAMRITTNYNQSLLKKRIMMMDAKRSNVHTLWKYFMLLPLLAVSICFLNKPVAMSAPLTKNRHATGNYVVSPKKGTAVKAYSSAKEGDSIIKTVDKPENNVSGYVRNQEHQSGRIPKDSLIALKSRGISLKYVQGIISAGDKNITINDIYPLHSRGITPEYIKGLVDAGYKNLVSTDVYALYSRHITIAYIKGFTNMGYKNLLLADIYALYSRGITPEYVKSLMDNGYKNLTLADIYDLHSRGITPE